MNTKLKTTHSILSKSLIATALLTVFAVPAFAQTMATTPTTPSTASEVQRDVNQQTRIEQGLKSGQLNTKEAARLEKGEARVDHLEANALKDGTLSSTEKARIQAAQNTESKAITADRHDAQTGNPDSASSKRMQADVQRNVNQQTRIENGVKAGDLNNRQVAGLERGQAKVNRREARAGANGHVSKLEQAKVQGSENVQSKRIHHQKTSA